MENYRFLYRAALDGKLPEAYALDHRFASDARLGSRFATVPPGCACCAAWT